MKSIITVGSALIFGSSLTSIFSSAPLNLALLSMLTIMIICTKRTAVLWTVALGAFLDIVSPLPTLSYFISFFLTFIFLRILMNTRISTLTIFGVLLSGVLGVFFLEFMLFVFSRVESRFLPGWNILLNYTYIKSLIISVIATGVSAAFIFALLKRSSLKIAGVRL
ncbi:hypothetical protein A3F52_04450 [Candidatus Uhrbacteria bacterium RIFCSPHIGHO2_12_FULL_47_11]|nr:MAG: hypothetical protein A3F52_04450 [Candidatus Uhrbacteria bacterium RIFCSPHIGHO2_12_FULL_47_11]